MHVGVALALLSFLGVWAIKGYFTIAGKMMAAATYDAISNHVFGVIPLFVLTGLLVSTAIVLPAARIASSPACTPGYSTVLSSM